MKNTDEEYRWRANMKILDEEYIWRAQVKSKDKVHRYRVFFGGGGFIRLEIYMANTEESPSTWKKSL